jgi:hypothetical protein
MDKQVTAAEKSVSKTKDEIIKEAKRIEEALLYSSKGNFTTARFWSSFHLWIGIPMVLMSAVAGASALAQFDASHFVAGILSILIAALSGVMTFLNPNSKAAAHLIWSIDCWQDESEQVLTEKLKYISEQKDNLNQTCPQPPKWAYRIAKRGIEAGEADYKVDRVAS